MPAPNTYGGCHEYFTELDLITNEPVGPWWAVCQPSCVDDPDCPQAVGSTAEPRCRSEEGEGRCELACEADAECPAGMECPEAVGTCMWPGDN